MIDAEVGRLLVASLHQGIADVLPSRLEFYESWLNPAGLRHGRIGLAPLAAVLSFLRQEGEVYHRVAARAGEYTAEWTVADLPAYRCAVIRATPPRLRIRLLTRIVSRMVRGTYRGSRVVVRWRHGEAAVHIRGSIFCEVRDPAAEPLCVFYASALQRLMRLFNLDVQIGTRQCRATGAQQCLMSMTVASASGEV